MVSKRDNENLRQEGMQEECPAQAVGESVVQIPEQTIQVIVEEFRRGTNLEELANKYGVSQDAWFFSGAITEQFLEPSSRYLTGRIVEVSH